MDVYDVIKNRRTIRRYKQNRIEPDVLIKLIECARVAPSGANMQPLKYMVIHEEAKLNAVFETLAWAGYIAPKGTPEEGERPVTYIIVLADKEIRENGFERDAGAAVQNILLMAHSLGIGSCWIGSVKREKLRENFKINLKYAIDCVIALGYPAEESVIEDKNGSIKYYKDENNVLHVPKRKMKDILL